MATSELEKAEKVERDLMSQRDSLVEDIAKLDAEIDATDVLDKKAVNRLEVMTSDRNTKQRILVKVEERLPEARAAVEAQRKLENAALVEEQWQEDYKDTERLVALVEEVAALLEAKRQRHQRIRTHGGMIKANVPNILVQAVRICLEHWRMWGWWHGEGGTMSEIKVEPPRKVTLPQSPDGHVRYRDSKGRPIRTLGG